MQLDLRGVSKHFGRHVALHDLTLQFDQAHTLVLIGPSGGGKSTLLRILAGLEVPDTGSVTLNQQPLRHDPTALLQHRRRVGVVFQAFNLFPHLTALANVTLPLEKVHGHSAAAAHEIAMEYLQRFHLEPHAAKRPAELSGGQRQRVAIARAVATKPQVLLFDEPTSALDPEMTAEVLDLIEELREEGRDLILVTHEMGFAQRAADIVVFLADGRVVETGRGQDLFKNARTEVCQRFLAKVLKY